jgi:hypothetical protein
MVWLDKRKVVMMVESGKRWKKGYVLALAFFLTRLIASSTS